MPENSVVADIKELVETRVELSSEEKILADKLVPHLRATLKPEVRKELEVEYVKQQKEYEEGMAEQTRVLVQKQFEDWKKDQQPISKEEISTLLSQEYAEYKISLKTKTGEIREFTLQELPQEAEFRFLKILREKGIPALKDLIAAEFTLEGDTSDQLATILTSSELILDVASRLVCIALDPWSDKNIALDWVKNNLSAYRVLTVILAQIEVNRYRDFLSNGFRLSKQIKTA